MKKNIVFAAVLLVMMVGPACMAYNPAVIGGVRNGTALGLVFESNPSNYEPLRFGFEADTSNSTPGIVFIGGKWYLSDINSRFPMFLSAGLLGYLGNSSSAGAYISLIFQRFLDISPLFLEVGVDVVNSGGLQLQLGYYF